MAIVEYNGEAAWHRLRATHVGASEVAALFSLSPWTTKWKLYMGKTGKLPPIDEKDWITKGRHFEAGIASYSREVFDLAVEKVDYYWTDDTCPGLGASFDYTLIDDRGVPIEIKWAEQYDGWEWTGTDLTQIPDYYMLQVQHQMACSGAARGILIAFIAGTVRYITVPRSDGIIGAIRTAVTSFWDDVRSGKEPPVDFLKDADTIMQLARYHPLKSLELPPRAAAIFQTFIDANVAEGEASDAKEAAKSELLKMVMDAGVGNDGNAVATCGEYKMKMTRVADNPGKVVTPAMVGTVIGVRKGHIRTTIGKSGE